MEGRRINIRGLAIGFLTNSDEYFNFSYFFSEKLYSQFGELHQVPVWSGQKTHIDTFVMKSREMIAALDKLNYAASPFYQGQFATDVALRTVLLKSRINYLIEGVIANKDDKNKLIAFLENFYADFGYSGHDFVQSYSGPYIKFPSQQRSLEEEKIKKIPYHLQGVEAACLLWFGDRCKSSFIKNLGLTFRRVLSALPKKDNNAAKIMIKLVLRAIGDRLVNSGNIDEFFQVFTMIKEHFDINLELEIPDFHVVLVNIVKDIIRQSRSLEPAAIQQILKVLKHIQSAHGVNVGVLIDDLDMAGQCMSKGLLLPFASMLEESKATHPQAFRNVGGVLVKIHPVLSALYSQRNFADFLKLIEPMSADSLPIYAEAKLDCKADYFSILLMSGFDYLPYVKNIIEEFSQYQQHACAILFEAVSRRDHENVASILGASVKAQINLFEESKKLERTGVMGHGLFADEKLAVRTEQSETSFNMKLSFTMPKLYQYIISKYKITVDKSSLFYSQNAAMMPDFLCDVGILLGKSSSYYEQLCVALARDLNIAPAVVKKTDDTSTNEELKAEVVKLKSAVIELKDENAKLKEKNAELDARMGKIEAMLKLIPFSLQGSEGDAESALRLFKKK